MSDTRNPWQTLHSRRVYENPWFTVREDAVIRPDGTPGTYSVVDTRIATGVVALTPAGEVYLVGQYRYPTDTYSWEIIEGGADPGEDPLAAIQRELREEAGLMAARWSPLGHEIHLSNCISSERGFLFVAEELTEIESEPDPTEVLTVRKLPLARCLELVRSGAITDGMSIMALFLLADRNAALNRGGSGGRT